ncbi:MAG: hypothetical protein IFK93_04470 [Acidobacteria bacterium]|nr:hypothetical protein [Candidatus Sulfomarinibacter kjeldsenii]
METRIAGQLLPHRLEPTGFSHEARARLGARRGGKNHDKLRLIGCEPPDDVAALRTAGRHLWHLVRIHRPTALEAAPFHQPWTQVVPCAEKDGGSDLCRFVSRVLVNERIGLEPLLEGLWSVYLGPVLLARFDEREGRIYS